MVYTTIPFLLTLTILSSAWCNFLHLGIFLQSLAAFYYNFETVGSFLDKKITEGDFGAKDIC